MQWSVPVCMCVLSWRCMDVAGGLRTSRGTCCMQWGAPVCVCVVIEMGGCCRQFESPQRHMLYAVGCTCMCLCCHGDGQMLQAV